MSFRVRFFRIGPFVKAQTPAHSEATGVDRRPGAGQAQASPGFDFESEDSGIVSELSTDSGQEQVDAADLQGMFSQATD
eukprot:9054860-Lingulodinium_polyedra.AAC.1